jgi:hypothetical protein
MDRLRRARIEGVTFLAGMRFAFCDCPGEKENANDERIGLRRCGGICDVCVADVLSCSDVLSLVLESPGGECRAIVSLLIAMNHLGPSAHIA